MTFTLWAIVETSGNIEPQVMGVGASEADAWVDAGVPANTRRYSAVRCSESITKGDWTHTEVVTVLGQAVLITDLDFPEEVVF